MAVHAARGGMVSSGMGVSLSRLYVLFFLSGASGLIYQIVWVRELGNVFGNTVHSASLVIAVFMLGLGVGSYVAGRWADRRYAARPGSLLASYGRVELAIGILGFSLSVGLPYLGAFSSALSSYAREPGGWYVLSTGSHVARYLVSVLVLTPVTLLMGATLTLLIRHAVRRDLELAGRRIGALYGVNTAGAALGCFLTDHVLIPAGGLRVTQLIAVALNLVAAAGALRLANTRGAAPSEAAGTPAAVETGRRGDGSGAAVALVGAAIAVSGFVAMGMEIVWFRHLSSLFGSYRSVLSLILTVILVGLWLGAMAGGMLQERVGRPALLYMGAQAVFLAATLAGLASADIRRVLADQYAAFPSFLAADGLRRDALDLWLTLGPVLREVAGPALLMGFAYPLANALVQRAEQSVGRRAGLLYLANTVGAVAGALAAGFVLIPALGMQRSLTVLAAVGAIGLVPLLALCLVRPEPGAGRRAASVGFAGAAAIAGTAIVTWSGLPADHLVRRTIWPPTPGERVLSVSEGLTEVVGVFDFPGVGRRLVTNGHSMSGTARGIQRYMRAFVHVPLLSMERPERVLVICFGVGNTLHAASLHPVARLELADTSAHVLGHAGHFADTNGNVLRDPRVSVFINDGRHHLRMQAPGTYDLITLEPPPIAFAGVGALYSREFYALARSRLRPGGYVTQWLPAYQVPGPAALAMVRAFVDVFPQTVLLSGNLRELILVGANADRIEIDPARVAERLRALPAVQEDLRRVDLGTLTELIGMFAAGPATLAAAIEPYAALTDDQPITEYASWSRLTHHELPPTLFDVTQVAAWCPRCFVGGEPIRDAADLPAHLALLGRVYVDPAFREYYSPFRPPDRPESVQPVLTPAAARALAASRYLQVVFAPTTPVLGEPRRDAARATP
jgi:spermidine synthase